MTRIIQAIRGMSDILPEGIPYWSFLEDACRSIVSAYGYHEIRFPIVEQTALFRRTIGEATDIVEKEMYTFTDRNGDSLTLRPEGTAGCVRAGIQNGLFYNQIQRLWYLGPMFRHERPQKGRFRQFYQLGVETYGMAETAIEVELILMCIRLWKVLGLESSVHLELNTLGTLDSQKAYRKALVAYLKSRGPELDEDSRRRLKTNPMRILDSKNPHMQTVLAEAPKILHYLDKASCHHFDQLRRMLEQAMVPFIVNPTLVRGLDYYKYTVFEWVTDQLGAQATVCAGGRYDNLVELLGGEPTPAAGFAAGLDRLVLLLRQVRKCVAKVDIYIVIIGELATQRGLLIAERIRDALPEWIIETHLKNGSSLKSQFKQADKSSARWAVVIGEKEIKTKTVTVKYLRETLPQKSLTLDALITYIKNMKIMD